MGWEVVLAICAVITVFVLVISVLVKFFKWGFIDDETAIEKNRYKTIRDRYPCTFSWIKKCILEKDSDKCCHFGSMDKWCDENEIDRESCSIPVINDDVFYPLEEYFLTWTTGEIYRYRESFMNFLKKDRQV